VANIRLLRREHPEARGIITWNAESNTDMVAVNDALGFRPRARFCQWQLRLSADRAHAHRSRGAAAGPCAELGRTRMLNEIPMHDALLADARRRATAYSLLQWSSPMPEEHLAAMAVLEARMSTDRRSTTLRGPETFDADRMRRRSAMISGRGMRQDTTVALHDATGELVGTTTLTFMSSIPTHADQWETIVLEEHRGHRFGMLLKVENLRFALRQEPALQYVDTENAESNVAMLRVSGRAQAGLPKIMSTRRVECAV
jgi:RimJ/RimL family protein N-acetyltransferase